MTEITQTNATETTATAVVATPKAPSKISQAQLIFNAKLVERSQGLFASNKEFRASVLTTIQVELGVSTASAATMYNAFKTNAEAADATIGLGRDPKTVKVKVAGAKRGRPAGSKNAPKTEVVVAEVATEQVEVSVPVSAEVVAEEIIA